MPTWVRVPAPALTYFKCIKIWNAKTKHMDKKLLEILACPKCKGDIKLKGKFLICEGCKLAYPILDGIPDMLIDDAWELQKAERSSFKHNLKL